MSPQPMSRITSRRNHYFGERAFERNPELAQFVAKVINIWSFTDARLALVLSEMLHADFETGTAMYQALTGGEAKKAALLAAAQVALSKEDQTLLRAVLKLTKPSRDRRNEYAHNLWGYSEEIPDALLLVDPKHVVAQEINFKKDTAAQATYRQAVNEHGELEIIHTSEPIDSSKIYVFRKGDFEEDLAAARTAMNYVSWFLLGIGKLPVAAEKRQLLLSQPPIQQALARLSKQNG